MKKFAPTVTAKRMRGATVLTSKLALVHLPEIFDAGGERESQFLHGVAAGFMPGAAVDADGLQRAARGRRPSG